MLLAHKYIAMCLTLLSILPTENTAFAQTSKTCEFSSPDTSVFDIALNDKRSSQLKLGSKIALDRKFAELPFAMYSSQDKKQILTLYFHPGGSPNEFAELQVAYADTVLKNSVDTKEFVTNSGIKLGISKSRLLEHMGTCFISTHQSGDCTTLVYRLTDNNSPFLRRYGNQSYYATYKFKQDKLVFFRFGFELP